MPGKIANSGQLSKASLLALRAEQQEGVKKHSFWDKWSNLSTGQKWGRALPWVAFLLPGIALHIKASIWQSRQAKVAGARPQESRISRSEESVGTTPLRSHIVFGKEHRLVAQKEMQPRREEPLVRAGGGYPPELEGLTIQYAKDLNRDADHTLISSDGRSVHYDGKSANKNTALRDFFRQEFPQDATKAEEWAVFASKFLSQSAAPGNLAVTKEIGEFSVPRDHLNLKLVLAEDGNSALLEVRAEGTPNDMPNVDANQSSVDNFLLARITLKPEEKLEVISGYSKHTLVAKADDSNVSTARAESLNNATATARLKGFAQGMFTNTEDRYVELANYNDSVANQPEPDFSHFRQAYQQLDDPESQQRLIGELARVVKGIEVATSMELMSSENDSDRERGKEMQREPRIGNTYPLSIQNALDPEKGSLVSNSRDLDIQSFVHRKVEEEIAQKHLGVTPEDFYQMIKSGIGEESILPVSYTSKEGLPPVLENLRHNLKADFQNATTLDDFYAKAKVSIEKAQQDAVRQ